MKKMNDVFFTPRVSYRIDKTKSLASVQFGIEERRERPCCGIRLQFTKKNSLVS